MRKVSELVVKVSAYCQETASSYLLPKRFFEFMHNVFSGAKQALNNYHVQSSQGCGNLETSGNCKCCCFLLPGKAMEYSEVNIFSGNPLL